MITTPTVLILGAGASAPYRFPIASELKQRICETFSHPNSAACQLLGKHPKHSPDEFFQFREAFLKAGQPSVDAFLEGQPKFLPVGKLAIAYCLTPFENESNLYAPHLERGGDWYQYLTPRLGASFEKFGENKLSIITFNYDRSFEHYLLNSLHNWHGRPVDECVAKLAQISIVHVYGQLGEHPYPQKECFPYDRPDLVAGLENVIRAADGITLYHEEAAAAAAEAREVLKAAKRVCFLGFSYDALNVARLDIGGSFDLGTTVIGTARGLMGMEVPYARNTVAGAIGGDIHLSDADNLEILRKNMFLG